MTVDVVNPDSTDPLALSEDRDEVRSRDATRSTGNLPPPAPTPVQDLDQLIQPEPEPDPVVLDTDLLQVSDNPNVPRVYPRIPANIINRTQQLDTNILPSGQDLFEQLTQQNQLFNNQQEFQLDANLQQALNDGDLLGVTNNLYLEPISPTNFHPRLPQLIEESVNFNTTNQINQIYPSNIDQQTGEVIPGTRNVMDNGFSSNLTRFLVGDKDSFEQTLPSGQPLRNLVRRFQDLNQGFAAVRQSQASRNLAARFIAANLQEPVRFVGSGIQSGETPERGIFETLAQNSLQARDVFQALGTPSDAVNPLRGQFGEFGSAGLLSGLFYGLNLVEGTASGALYELTNRFWDYDRDDPVRITDALIRGRDLGFTNQADDNKYLSFINNPRLERVPVLRNRGVQIGLGFAADIVWGGAFDYDTVIPAARAAARSAVTTAGRTAVDLSLLSRLNLTDVSTRLSTPLPDVLNTYRNTPELVQPSQLNITRRTDQQLSNLATIHGLNPSNELLTPLQIHNLQISNPLLMSRYGNAIPDVPQLPPSQVARSPISDVTVRNLTRRRDRILSELDITNNPADQSRLIRQLNTVNQRLRNLTIESSPESVQDLYIRSLPPSSAPLTNNSQILARRLSDAESKFVESTNSARYLQAQRIEVDEILQEQRRLFEETPPVERTSLRHETSTRNNYTPDGVPNVAQRPVITVDAISRQIIDELPTSANPPRSLRSHLQSNGSWYHGTKSVIGDVANNDYTRGSSITNELGPGLYITTDPNLARNFAKAQPTVDRPPNPILRSNQVGQVISLNVSAIPDAFIDASQTYRDHPIRDLFIQTVREELGTLMTNDPGIKLISAAQRISRTKPFRDWIPELRINFNRLRPDSQTDLVKFNGTFVKRLSDGGAFGSFYRTSDGHITAAIYNDSINTPLPINSLGTTNIGSGLPEEQVYNRFLVDELANRELNTRTTKANMESSKLAVDRLARENLGRAGKDAYQRSLDDTRNMLDVERALEETVEREQKEQLESIQENSIRNARTQLRKWRGENSSPCI